MIFAHEMRVRYHDTDHAGRAYHANYVKWLEDARVEFLRAKGVDYKLLEQNGTYLAVTSLNIDYQKAIDYDALISIIIKKVEKRKLKIDFFYEILNNEGERSAKALISLVCLSALGKPVRIPRELLEIIT
jgi:acyl-CoA thioester hydrolase